MVPPRSTTCPGAAQMPAQVPSCPVLPGPQVPLTDAQITQFPRSSSSQFPVAQPFPGAHVARSLDYVRTRRCRWIAAQLTGCRLMPLTSCRSDAVAHVRLTVAAFGRFPVDEFVRSTAFVGSFTFTHVHVQLVRWLRWLVSSFTLYVPRCPVRSFAFTFAVQFAVARFQFCRLPAAPPQRACRSPPRAPRVPHVRPPQLRPRPRCRSAPRRARAFRVPMPPAHLPTFPPSCRPHPFRAFHGYARAFEFCAPAAQVPVRTLTFALRSRSVRCVR